MVREIQVYSASLLLIQSQYDSSLFLRKTPTGLVLLLVNVDDIVITGSDSTLIAQL